MLVAFLVLFICCAQSCVFGNTWKARHGMYLVSRGLHDHVVLSCVLFLGELHRLRLTIIKLGSHVPTTLTIHSSLLQEAKCSL